MKTAIMTLALVLAATVAQAEGTTAPATAPAAPAPTTAAAAPAPVETTAPAKKMKKAKKHGKKAAEGTSEKM